MTDNLSSGDLSERMRLGLQKARVKFLEQEAQLHRLVVVADKDGRISHVSAIELLRQARLLLP